MTTVSSTKNRLKQLRTQVMGRKGSFIEEINPFCLDMAIWKAFKPGRSRIQKRAAFLYEEVNLAPIEIPPLWSLAGEHLPLTKLNQPGLHKNLTGQGKRRLDEYNLSEEQQNEMTAAVNQWYSYTNNTVKGHEYYAIGESDPSTNRGRGDGYHDTKSYVYWARGWVENHSIRDYEKVIRIGFKGIRKEVEYELNIANITDPNFPEKENFLKAALTICDAGILLGEKYANLANNMLSNSNNQSEKERLQKMVRTCKRVPTEGATTFFEAIQSLWFAHILTCGEDNINANSLGRLDQFLYPYFKKDLENGNLNREEAVAIMEEFACKLYLDYDVQAITLSGQDTQGDDSTNDLSYIILEATKNVNFIRDLSVRLHDNSPDELIDQCSEQIINGGGIPFIFNDECLIQALTDRGIKPEDARDYAPIGCIELTIPGKANPHAVSGWINSTKALELAIFGGKDPITNEQLGPRTPVLQEIKSYDEVFKYYCIQLEYFSQLMVYHCNMGELKQREKGPLPCWSILTDNCITRGRDITNCGAIYNYHSICFLGTANTADSLMALKKLVFDNQSISPQLLMDALKNNFQGFEHIRKQLIRDAPKYGNDQESVDQIASTVTNHFIDYMDQFISPLGGKYFVHLFSFLCNLNFGKATGATPDGRKAGDPLAYSLSAHQGRDETGITAMLKSLSKLPHHKAAGSSAAIVDLSPKLVEGKAGKQRLNHLIKTLIKMRVGQIQFNVVTAERLKKAQQEPENYGNIPVRVAGYSQLFNLIGKDLQDHIIARTKHIE